MRLSTIKSFATVSIIGLATACGGATVPSGPGTPDAGSKDAHTQPTPDGGRDDAQPTRDGGRGGDAPSTKDTGKPPVMPLNHRPNDSQCMTVPPASNCDFGGGSGQSCGSFGTGTGSGTGSGTGDPDSTCTMGTNGRCIGLQGPAGCVCTYDACSGDTDCPAQELCVCHGSAYSNQGNTCMPGNCRVDSDCPDNGYCSPSATGGCGDVGGYYCHTPKDQCVNDSDCGGGVGLESCVWSSDSGSWTCQPTSACG